MCPHGPLVAQVMLTSSTLRSGFRWTAHWLYPVSLLNAAPKRSGLVKHPDVPMHSLPTEPRQPRRSETGG
jgi:hypothetical protein